MCSGMALDRAHERQRHAGAAAGVLDDRTARRSRPSASAASIIASAIRSFMLPVGFCDSSFTENPRAAGRHDAAKRQHRRIANARRGCRVSGRPWSLHRHLAASISRQARFSIVGLLCRRRSGATSGESSGRRQRRPLARMPILISLLPCMWTCWRSTACSIWASRPCWTPADRKRADCGRGLAVPRFEVRTVSVRRRVVSAQGLVVPTLPIGGRKADCVVVPAIGYKMPEPLERALSRRDVRDAADGARARWRGAARR